MSSKLREGLGTANECLLMRVCVFGLGYVGVVTAACLARAGHQVTGADINQEKVALVNAGPSPVVEPGLGNFSPRSREPDGPAR